MYNNWLKPSIGKSVVRGCDPWKFGQLFHIIPQKYVPRISETQTKIPLLTHFQLMTLKTVRITEIILGGGQKMYVLFFSTSFAHSVFHCVQQLLSDTWVIFQMSEQKHTFTRSISYCGPIVSATEQQTSLNRSNVKFQEYPLCSSQPVTYIQLGMTQSFEASHSLHITVSPPDPTGLHQPVSERCHYQHQHEHTDIGNWTEI
jgi:hypothetical protein